MYKKRLSRTVKINFEASVDDVNTAAFLLARGNTPVPYFTKPYIKIFTIKQISINKHS